MEVSIFASRLAAGLTWALSASDRRAVASGYFRTCLLVALGLVALAGAAGWRSLETAQVVLLVVAAGACYLGQAAWCLERSSAGNLGQLVAGLALLLFVAMPSETVSGKGWLVAGNAVSASALLGASLAAMLLGHYYLTAPWMPADPLYRMLLGILLAGVLRAGATGLGGVSLADTAAVTASEIGGGLFLTLRWGVGIAAPIVLALMAWRTLDHKHTQAATGLAYVIVICVLLGETTALMLDRPASGAMP